MVILVSVEIINQMATKLQENKKHNRKLVAWMVSNCDAKSDRELYVQQLKEFSELDLKYKFYLRYINFSSV